MTHGIINIYFLCVSFIMYVYINLTRIDACVGINIQHVHRDFTHTMCVKTVTTGNVQIIENTPRHRRVELAKDAAYVCTYYIQIYFIL